MTDQLLFCSASLLSLYITLISPILTALQVPRCRPKIATHMEFNWRLDLELSLCPLWLRGGGGFGGAGGWDAVSADICTDFSQPSWAHHWLPRGGSNWFWELLGTFPSFTDIFPSPIKKHTQPSSHKPFLFPPRSLTYMHHELNSRIQGIHVFKGYILKTLSDHEMIIHSPMIHWKEINLQLNQYLLFKCN